MGLIDSTNRIERAILSDKQARRLEREEKKRERKEKERDKLDLSISRDLMQEGLYNEFSGLYNQLGYNGASLYLKSLDSRQRILNKICSNELEYKTASGLYDKTLTSIDKIYKRNEEYNTAQALEELKEQHQQEEKKNNFNNTCLSIAKGFYIGIIGILKTLGFFLLICMGLCKFICGIQPQQKKRYR